MPYACVPSPGNTDRPGTAPARVKPGGARPPHGLAAYERDRIEAEGRQLANDLRFIQPAFGRFGAGLRPIHRTGYAENSIARCAPASSNMAASSAEASYTSALIHWPTLHAARSAVRRPPDVADRAKGARRFGVRRIALAGLLMRTSPSTAESVNASPGFNPNRLRIAPESTAGLLYSNR